MWISVTPNELDIIRVNLTMGGEHELRDNLEKQEETCMSKEAVAYRDAAIDKFHKEGECEIDVTPDGSANVSFNDDGAYVMCWRFLDMADVPGMLEYEGTDEVDEEDIPHRMRK